MMRPPATRRKTYSTIPSGGLSGIESVRTADGFKNLVMIGVLFHGDGDLVAIDSDPETAATPAATAVLAGQFWALRLQSIDETTTALPLTVLWGPLREA